MVATSVTTPGPGPALPETVSQSTRIDLRSLGLIAGAPAERLLAVGQAVRLAGGRFAFSACQVLFREGPRITGAIAPIGGALLSGPEFEEGNGAQFTGRARPSARSATPYSCHRKPNRVDPASAP